MGYDLSNATGTYRLNMWSWQAAYALGEQHGWKPAGTVPSVSYLRARIGLPDDTTPESNAELAAAVAGWSGGYHSNSYQTVTAEDAAGWADALERALPDVPRHDALAHKTLTVGGIEVIDGDTPVSPVELFSGKEGRKRLTAFIAFCRAGSFSIG